MYICKNCGNIFKEPEIYEEKHGLDTPPYEKRLCCPYCHQDDFKETHRCEVCGEYIEGEYIYIQDIDKYVCEDCYIRKNT